MSERIETPNGPINVYPIDTNTVRVDAGIPMNVEPWEPITIRGVNYAVQSFLYRWSDGRFHCGRAGDDPDARQSRWREPHLSRQWSDRQDVSTSAQDAVRALVEQVVDEWSAANARALAEAEVEQRTRDLGYADNDVEKAHEALAVAREKRNKIARQLRSARRRLGEQEETHE